MPPPASSQAKGKGKAVNPVSRQPTIEFIMVDPSQKSQSRVTRRSSTLRQVNRRSSASTISIAGVVVPPTDGTGATRSVTQPPSSGRGQTTNARAPAAPYVKPTVPPAYVPPPSGRDAATKVATSRSKEPAGLSTNARKELLSYLKRMEHTADREAIMKFLNLDDSGESIPLNDEEVSRSIRL